jgi:hypothetical protein
MRGARDLAKGNDTRPELVKQFSTLAESGRSGGADVF